MQISTNALKIALLKSFENRWNEPQITILKRIGSNRAYTLTGADILFKSSRLIDQWHSVLGHRQQRLVLALPPGESFLISLVAGLLGGATVIPVSPPRPGTQVVRFRHIVADSGATAVIGDAGNSPSLVRHLTQDNGMTLCPVYAMSTEGQLLEQDSGVLTSTPPLGQTGLAPAIIQYTSGSTRMPKGVRIFPEQIIANSAMVGNLWHLNEKTRFVNWLPHYHDMGLMGGIIYPLLLGAFSVQISPLEMIRNPAFWLQAISDFKGTMSGGPAFSFEQCLSRINDADCYNLDLSSWETAFCGAEPVPANLLRRFTERFGLHGLKPNAVFACYGMAEFTLFAAGQHEHIEPPSYVEWGNTHPCRLTAATRSGLAIVDPESARKVQEGQQGEIWLRGPSKGCGYENLSFESDSTFVATLQDDMESPSDDCWLRTGDLGVTSGEWLYITGRIKDLLIINGRNVAATEVEWLGSAQHKALNPFAAAAFVIDQNIGKNAALFIELKSAGLLIEDASSVLCAIRRSVQGEWGIDLRDIRILSRGTLDRTSSGKIRRAGIAAAYRQGIFPPEAATIAKLSEDNQP